jgi:hypothetical protein
LDVPPPPAVAIVQNNNAVKISVERAAEIQARVAELEERTTKLLMGSDLAAGGSLVTAESHSHSVTLEAANTEARINPFPQPAPEQNPVISERERKGVSELRFSTSDYAWP